MSKLYYQGHGSYRIETNNNKIIYVDPFVNGGCEKEADLILVTHNHFDHSRLELITKKQDCIVVTPEMALKDNKHNTFDFEWIKITAVEAYNKNHSASECVGYVLFFDGITLYASGDTSKTNDMKNKLSKLNIDYALLPIDGIFNMDIKEAEECAKIIGAKHTIPIHTMPVFSDRDNSKNLFSKERADKFSCNSKLVLEPNEEISL